MKALIAALRGGKFCPRNVALVFAGGLLLSGCGGNAEPATFIRTVDGQDEYAFRAAQMWMPDHPRTDEEIVADWAQRRGTCPQGYDIVSMTNPYPHWPHPKRVLDVVVRCKTAP